MKGIKMLYFDDDCVWSDGRSNFRNMLISSPPLSFWINTEGDSMCDSNSFLEEYLALSTLGDKEPFKPKLSCRAKTEAIMRKLANENEY